MKPVKTQVWDRIEAASWIDVSRCGLTGSRVDRVEDRSFSFIQPILALRVTIQDQLKIEGYLLGWENKYLGWEYE